MRRKLRPATDEVATAQTTFSTRAVRLTEVRSTMHVIADATLPAGPLLDDITTACVLRSHFNLDNDPQENMIAAYLDARGNLLAAERVFRGTSEFCTVSTREIVRGALLCNASQVVVCHNHPSGDPSPSSDDITFTNQLRDALLLLDLKLSDHIIIGGKRHRSMSTAGLLTRWQTSR